MTDEPTRPQVFCWDGEAMWPLNASLADQQYVVGEKYRLEAHHERSERSHRHLFACIKDGWMNLPENMGAQWPTPEHFRAWLLIKVGHYSERCVVADSDAEADRLTTLAETLDEFALVLRRERTVSIYRPKSISYRALNSEEFKEVKNRVMDLLESLLDVDSRTIEAEAGQAA